MCDARVKSCPRFVCPIAADVHTYPWAGQTRNTHTRRQSSLYRILSATYDEWTTADKVLLRSIVQYYFPS